MLFLPEAGLLFSMFRNPSAPLGHNGLSRSATLLLLLRPHHHPAKWKASTLLLITITFSPSMPRLCCVTLAKLEAPLASAAQVTHSPAVTSFVVLQSFMVVFKYRMGEPVLCS